MLRPCHQAVPPSGDWSAVGNHLQIHLDPASSSIFLQHKKIWQFIGDYFPILCAKSLWIQSKCQRPEAPCDLYFKSMWFETWLMHQKYWYILHVSWERHKNIHGSHESLVDMLCMLQAGQSRAWALSILQNIWTRSGNHQSSYYIDTGGFVPTWDLKSPGHECHHSPTTNIKVKNQCN